MTDMDAAERARLFFGNQPRSLIDALAEQIRWAETFAHEKGRQAGRDKALTEAEARLRGLGEPDCASIVWSMLADKSLCDWLPWPAPEDGKFTVVYRSDAGVFGARFTQARCDCCTWPETCGEEMWFTEAGEDLTGDLPTMWLRPKLPSALKDKPEGGQ